MTARQRGKVIGGNRALSGAFQRAGHIGNRHRFRRPGLPGTAVAQAFARVQTEGIYAVDPSSVPALGTANLSIGRNGQRVPVMSS